MSLIEPTTRCFQGIPCGFASDELTPQNCQGAMTASYDVLSEDVRELADQARCPLAVSRWLIHGTPPEALRKLPDGKDGE